MALPNRSRLLGMGTVRRRLDRRRNAGAPCAGRLASRALCGLWRTGWQRAGGGRRLRRAAGAWSVVLVVCGCRVSLGGEGLPQLPPTASRHAAGNRGVLRGGAHRILETSERTAAAYVEPGRGTSPTGTANPTGISEPAADTTAGAGCLSPRTISSVALACRAGPGGRGADSARALACVGGRRSVRCRAGPCPRRRAHRSGPAAPHSGALADQRSCWRVGEPGGGRSTSVARPRTATTELELRA